MVKKIENYPQITKKIHQVEVCDMKSVQLASSVQALCNPHRLCRLYAASLTISLLLIPPAHIFSFLNACFHPFCCPLCCRWCHQRRAFYSKWGFRLPAGTQRPSFNHRSLREQTTAASPELEPHVPRHHWWSWPSGRSRCVQ